MKILNKRFFLLLYKKVMKQQSITCLQSNVNNNLNDVTDKISYITIKIRLFLHNYTTFDKHYSSM